MEWAIINGRWRLQVPDCVASWDGPTGDPSIPSGWEHERLASIQRHHRYGDLFFDIGAEHGWMSALIQREFVGPNMVLFEPSPSFWPNIRLTWLYNGLDRPLAMWQGFVGRTSRQATAILPDPYCWPIASSSDQETEAMAYRSLLTNGNAPINTISLDDFMIYADIQPTPNMSLNIDVEGAEMEVLVGATKLLTGADAPRNVWVSVHPDLMAAYDTTDRALVEFMLDLRYKADYLGRDHEDHYHFWKH